MRGPNQELSDFLRRARASVDPNGVRLPADGRVRRVAGLRREEAAFLAGVSNDYYSRLEQGRRTIAGLIALNRTQQCASWPSHHRRGAEHERISPSSQAILKP